MRNRICSLCAFVLISISMKAFTTDFQFGEPGISVSLNYVDPSSATNGGSRTPAKRPTIYIIGNTIQVPENLVGYELEISSGGMLIYSTAVTSTEILLPEALSEGCYQIRFFGETYTFYGEVEL